MDKKLSEELLKIRGTVEEVSYRSPNGGFTVALLDVDGEPVNVVGDLGLIEEGESLDVTGRFVEHHKYGYQFSAEICESSLPETVSGIQKYLSSGVIKGIGPVLA